MYREKIKVKGNRIRAQYYIINTLGDVVGRVPVYTSQADSIRIDYWLKEEYQGKGIGTIVLEEIIKQIYIEKEFDGVEIPSRKYPYTVKTAIKNIDLEIPFYNEASKRIAIKNGFKEEEKEEYTSYFSLTLEDYMKQREDTER